MVTPATLRCCGVPVARGRRNFWCSLRPETTESTAGITWICGCSVFRLRRFLAKRISTDYPHAPEECEQGTNNYKCWPLSPQNPSIFTRTLRVDRPARPGQHHQSYRCVQCYCYCWSLSGHSEGQASCGPMLHSDYQLSRLPLQH